VDDVEMRARNIPFGRVEGRGGVRSTTMSMAELERVTRRYTAGIIETLGPDSMCRRRT